MSSFQHVSGRDKSPKAMMAHQGAFKGFRLLSAQSLLGSFSPSLSLSHFLLAFALSTEQHLSRHLEPHQALWSSN